MTCPVCGNNKPRQLDYGGYRYKETDFPLVECENCGLKYIVHKLGQHALEDIYNEPGYFESEYEGGGTALDYIRNESEIKFRARRALRIICKHIAGKHLLEIGSAGGYFLETAKQEFGFNPVGVEVSTQMVAWGKGRGLAMYTDLSEVPSEIKFDVIYMGDVLEHIPQPKDFLQSLRPRLADHGAIVLELPLTFNLSFSGIILGIANWLKGRRGYRYFLPAQHRRKFLEKPPYHLIMFNRRSMRFFFEELGFHIEVLRIYEGMPKEKFRGTPYWWLKAFGHVVSYYIAPVLGDRMFVLATMQ